jgi:hypothetical protein
VRVDVENVNNGLRWRLSGFLARWLALISGKGAENSPPRPPFSATFSQVQRLIGLEYD